MYESKKTQAKFAAVLLLLVFLFVRLVTVGINHCTILDAIRDYKLDCIYSEKPCYVEYDDRENINDTFCRLWDWSYKRILDNDDYKIIKPYIRNGSWADAAGEYF